MTLAEELKIELQREAEEFHVINPRKYFLDYIADIIRKREDHKAPLLDFRGKCIAAQFLLRNDSDILTEWDDHYYYDNIPSKDVEVIRFTCDIVHEDGYTDSGKRTDPKYFKLGFYYLINWSNKSILRRYVYEGSEVFNRTVGRMEGRKFNLPEFPKQFLKWRWDHEYKEYDYRPDEEGQNWRKWKHTKEDNYRSKTFIGRDRYEVLSKFLKFWNSWMETLEFLCFHGWKSALLGEVLVNKYPGLVYFGRETMNSYIFTMYNKFKNKEKDLHEWKVDTFNEYTGQFESIDLDESILNSIYHLVTEFFGYEIWEDLRHRHKLPTDEDIQIISELDETSFRGSYPAKTFKDFILQSLDCDALPSGIRELPNRMDGLEHIQYAEVVS